MLLLLCLLTFQGWLVLKSQSCSNVFESYYILISLKRFVSHKINSQCFPITCFMKSMFWLHLHLIIIKIQWPTNSFSWLCGILKQWFGIIRIFEALSTLLIHPSLLPTTHISMGVHHHSLQHAILISNFVNNVTKLFRGVRGHTKKRKIL